MTHRDLRRFVVFGFATTHDALAAETALKEGDIEAVPIPTPKALGELCGIALRVEEPLAREARAALDSASVSVASETTIEDV